ncbi:MAG: hypothetical protein AAF653_06855 [Chloroflexota bacterium]
MLKRKNKPYSEELYIPHDMKYPRRILTRPQRLFWNIYGGLCLLFLGILYFNTIGSNSLLDDGLPGMLSLMLLAVISFNRIRRPRRQYITRHNIPTINRYTIKRRKSVESHRRRSISLLDGIFMALTLFFLCWWALV